MMKKVIVAAFLIAKSWGFGYAQTTEQPLTWETFDQGGYEKISLDILSNYEEGQRLFKQYQDATALECFEKNIKYRREIEFAAKNLYSVGTTGYPNVRKEEADEYFAYYNSVYRIGQIQQTLGNLNEALPKFETMTERFPLWKDGYHCLAETYKGLDRLDQAIAVYRRMVDTYEEISQHFYVPELTYREIASISIRMGLLEDAVQAGFAASRISDPARGHAILIAAFAAAKLKDNTSFFRLMAEALSVTKPEQLKSWEWAGLHQKRFREGISQGEIETVIGFFAIWSIEKTAGTEAERGEALRRLDSPEADSKLTRVYHQATFDPYGAYLLSCLFSAKGQTDKAVDFLRLASNDSLSIAQARIAEDEDLAALRSLDIGAVFPGQPAEKPPDYEGIADAGDVRLVVQNGHSLEVVDLALSPDERLIATASGDQSVNMWSVDGVLLQTLSGEGRGMHVVAFSPRGAFLAAGDNGGRVHLWSLNGSKKWTQGGGYPIGQLAFSPDGRFIASGRWGRGNGADYSVQVWTLDGRLYDEFYGHTQPASGLAFSQDSRYLATASEDGSVRIWSSLEGGEVVSFSLSGAAQGLPRSIFFGKDRSLLVQTSSGVSRYDWSGKLLETLVEGLSAYDTVRFGSDGSLDVLKREMEPSSFVTAQSSHTYNSWSSSGVAVVRDAA